MKKLEAPVPPPDPVKARALAAARAFAARVRAVELKNPYGSAPLERTLEAYRNGGRPDLRPASSYTSSPHEERGTEFYGDSNSEEDYDDDDNREGGEGYEDNKEDRKDDIGIPKHGTYMWNGADGADRHRLSRLHLLGPRFDADHSRRGARDKIVKNIYNVRALQDFRRARVYPHALEQEHRDITESSVDGPQFTPLRMALGRPSTSPTRNS